MKMEISARCSIPHLKPCLSKEFCLRRVDLAFLSMSFKSYLTTGLPTSNNMSEPAVRRCPSK